VNNALAACQNDYHPQEPRGTEGLRVQERTAEQLAPILYIPTTDLVTSKESPESLKIKLPNGIDFNMSIFSRGNTKKYLAHVIAVLHLINKKGFNMQCRKLAKADDELF
jgi:hypothetical protein